MAHSVFLGLAWQTTSSGLAVLAGNGTATYHLGGPIFASATAVANEATTNYAYFDFNAGSVATVPANTLAHDLDSLLVRVNLTLSSATSSGTTQVNLGYTARGAAGFTAGVNLYSAATTTASNDIDLYARIVRTSAGHQIVYSVGVFTGGAQQGTQKAATTLDETAALAIAVGIKDGSSNAARVTVNHGEVFYVPAP